MTKKHEDPRLKIKFDHHPSDVATENSNRLSARKTKMEESKLAFDMSEGE